jgi:hypothetical protein
MNKQKRVGIIAMAGTIAVLLLYILVTDTLHAPRRLKCNHWSDELSFEENKLNNGTSSNWSGWCIDVEKYIGECIGQRMLEDLDLR